MKGIILQENLLLILKDIISFVPSSPQLIILENILIESKENGLYITATDLSIGIQKKARAKIEKKGKLCVNAKNLYSFVSQLTPGKIEFWATENAFIVKNEKTRAEFNIISAKDYPEIRPIADKKEIRKKEINQITQKTAFSAASDETRAVLTGVLLERKEEKTRAVATDGFRLSLKELKQNIIKKNSALIIPARLFKEINRIIPEGEKIFFEEKSKEGKMVLSWKNTTINTRLIEGKFPDYEKIIPQAFVTRATFEREEFEKSVKTVAIFARESANIVRLEIKKNKIVLSANSPQTGKSKSEQPAKTEGEDQKTAFNYRFLLDFLKSTNSEEITFETKGQLKPGVFKAANDPSYLHIIMPVRVQDEGA